MAKIRIIVRFTGAGWVVCSTSRRSMPLPRPYAQRDEALSDAVFASRMLKAMGEDVSVFIDGPGGLVSAEVDAERVWLKH